MADYFAWIAAPIVCSCGCGSVLDSDGARERARALLLRALTTEQRESLVTTGWIPVRSKTSGRRYRIRAAPGSGRDGNIQAVAEDGVKPIANLCCAPGGRIPVEDAWLGQVLALTYDEANFLQKANRYGY